MDAKRFLDCMATSLSYNMDYCDLTLILQGVLDRVDGTHDLLINDAALEEYVDFIYGTLVVAYGDYGTSPRSGWLNSKDKDLLIPVLRELVDYYDRMVEVK